MKTFARREGSDWILNGSKRWIGMGTIADVAVVWARTDEEGNPVRGFLVPTDAPGFTARDITGKLSMRASVQCDLSFEDVRLPAEAMLPGAEGLKGPFACLNEARYGIIWGSMGAARDSFECALEYAREREQFEARGRLPAHPGEARQHDARGREGHAPGAAPRAHEDTKGR